MSDLAEFQDVVDWVREGLGTVRFDQVRGTAKQASVRRTPTRRRRRRRVVVAISVGVIAAAAVTAPLVILGDTPPSPLSPSSSEPVVSTSSAPGPTTVSEDVFVSFSEAQPVDLFLSQALYSISEYREIYVGRCMAAHGFPEVLEADALVDDELSGWGEWHVESGLFGPDTPEQALQHGYLGREWWGGGEEPPKLVSSDPEFLAAADECGQEWDSALPVAGLYLEYSGDIGNRVSEAMYRAMQRNVEVEAAAVFNEWLGCIETAGFTPEGAGISFGFGIEAEGGGGMATYFGVEVGAWKDGRDPDTTPLPAGTTEIRQGGSRGVYVPTDAEVELAMVDVACKEEIRFWQRLYPMLMGIQREAMAAIQGELLQLNPEIEALAGRAQSLSEQRALVSELVGVWPPPIPAVEVPEGATWPCPPVEPKVDQVLDAADVPDEIRYLPAGDTYHVDAAWGVNYGPACRRSPALVAVDFDAEDRSSADAVVVVWVEAPDVFGHPPDPPGGMPRIEPREEMAATVDVDGFVVRYHPATEWMTERVEMVGVIDGLPVWIQASGMTPEALSVVVRLMTASAATGEVRVTPPDNFEVVRSGPVVAEVIDNVVWFVEGIGGLSVQVQRAPGFDPYVSALGFTESFTFVDVGGSVGVLFREGGGTGSVMWAIQPGIFAMVQDDGTFQELVELAEQLTRVPTS